MSETNRTPKRVGIVGLGLIGGSFAKAYADAGIEVFAADIDERAMNAAMAEETDDLRRFSSESKSRTVLPSATLPSLSEAPAM